MVGLRAAQNLQTDRPASLRPPLARCRARRRLRVQVLPSLGSFAAGAPRGQFLQEGSRQVGWGCPQGHAGEALSPPRERCGGPTAAPWHRKRLAGALTAVGSDHSDPGGLGISPGNMESTPNFLAPRFCTVMHSNKSLFASISQSGSCCSSQENWHLLARWPSQKRTLQGFRARLKEPQLTG